MIYFMSKGTDGEGREWRVSSMVGGENVLDDGVMLGVTGRIMELLLAGRSEGGEGCRGPYRVEMLNLSRWGTRIGEEEEMVRRVTQCQVGLPRVEVGLHGTTLTLRGGRRVEVTSEVQWEEDQGEGREEEEESKPRNAEYDPPGG